MLTPGPADDDTIALVHSREYIAAVMKAGADPKHFVPTMGLGTGDNPVVPLLHEISAMIVGGAVAGMREVLEGRREATFNVAGGLHHAHRSRAAGFCVYNDPAIVEPILGNVTPLEFYDRGTWGPPEATGLAADIGGWHNPEGTPLAKRG